MASSELRHGCLFPAVLLLITAAGSSALAAGSCNLYEGRWVADPSGPLYNKCPFIDAEFDCSRRPDKAFLKYAWKPDSCNLPRFNGLDLVRRWRGKKIMFVGDSLSLNQWESLACMIYASVPGSDQYKYVRQETLSSVVFTKYAVTIEYYRSTYLVDITNGPTGPVLNLTSITQGRQWGGRDVLVFGTWHWWTHKGSSRPWKSIQDGTHLYPNMHRLLAFHKGLTTWAQWVDNNVDPSKTKVFFQGISPIHSQGSVWGSTAKDCSNEQRPYSGSTYPAGMPEEAKVVFKVLESMRKPVTLLNITTLSQLRKDAHPSLYGEFSNGVVDCSHWCLPGLPDTWNQLLYASL